MSENRVMVELRQKKIVRIFKGRINWQELAPDSEVCEYPRKDAVESIRTQVRERAGNACERCGGPLTTNTGQMHERLPRSMGGEVSLENCWWLCHACHQGRNDSEHKNRRLHFGDSKMPPR